MKENNLRKIIFVLVILLLFGLASSYSSVDARQPTFSFEAEQHQHQEPLLENDNENLSFSVILRAESGHSFAQEINYILNYPEIKSMEEAEIFLDRYRASDKTIRSAIESLEASGFKVVTATPVSMTVVSTKETINSIIADDKVKSSIMNEEAGLILQSSLKNDFKSKSFIDCLIFSDPMLENNISYLPETIDENQKPFPHNKMLISSNTDLVHRNGITGRGVRIGLIDDRLISSNYYFRSNPTTINYYWVNPITGNVVKINKPIGAGPTHGTYVGSVIASSAPDANLISFFPRKELLTFFEFIYSNDVVDVINMSLSYDEITPRAPEYLARVRALIVQLISQGKLIVISGGNLQKCPAPPNKPPCSNKNGLAAIPEVVSVGGLDFEYDDYFVISKQLASENAISFTSGIFPNRNVPDIAAFFGPIDTMDYKTKPIPIYGTSFSAPQVAGMLALLKQQIPDINQFRAKSLLMANTLDITEGRSGTGDYAGPGYDRATGYGLPLADRVVQRTYYLLEGWNLVAFPIYLPSGYSARELLSDIRESGGRCNNVTMWDISRGMYVAFQVDDNGNEYGIPFSIDPGQGYFIRCASESTWSYSEYPLIKTPLTLQLAHGHTLFSIPFTDKQCTAKHLLQESNGVCNSLTEYNGQFFRYDGYRGHNFLINPLKGYFAFCNSKFTWTPQCDPINPEEDGEILDLDLDQEAITEVTHTTTEMPVGSLDEDIPNGASCGVYEENISNVTGNTFSVRWITYDNCVGSVIVDLGNGMTREFFDVRGINYQGSHHLINVEGLESSTTYSVTIKSGNSFNQGFSYRTGLDLTWPTTNHKVTGYILNRDGTPAVDATCGARIEDQNWGYSMDISFVPSKENGGFSINMGNFREAMNENAGGYFDLSTVTRMIIHCRTYSTYVDQFNIPLDPSNPSADIGAQTIGRNRYPMQLFYPWDIDLDNTRPTFTMHASQQSEEVLYYRLEISHDNFYTVDYIFDQYSDSTGWSLPVYDPSQVATFTIPFNLERGVSYQWRATASPYPPRREWGRTSETGTFVINPLKLYLPVILDE